MVLGRPKGTCWLLVPTDGSIGPPCPVPRSRPGPFWSMVTRGCGALFSLDAPTACSWPSILGASPFGNFGPRGRSKLLRRGPLLCPWNSPPSAVLPPPPAPGLLVLASSAPPEVPPLDIKTGKRAGQY